MQVAWVKLGLPKAHSLPVPHNELASEIPFGCSSLNKAIQSLKQLDHPFIRLLYLPQLNNAFATRNLTLTVTAFTPLNHEEESFDALTEIRTSITREVLLKTVQSRRQTTESRRAFTTMKAIIVEKKTYCTRYLLVVLCILDKHVMGNVYMLNY